MSLREAVSLAVTSHPSVNAARADRRATGHELRIAQGALYPNVSVAADIGQQYVDRPESLDPEDNALWRDRRQASILIRQVLFSGHQRANEIYRAAARLDATALRVLSGAEILALDAVEAYIDFRRHSRLLSLARANVERHREILGLVQELVAGGKAPGSDANQTLERVAGAEAIAAQVELAYQEARAKFKQVIGVKPGRTKSVHYPPHLPRSARVAVDFGLANNPALASARANIDAARFALQRAKGAFAPTVALEGAATYGHDVNGVDGRNVDVTGRLTLNWDLFDGHIRRSRARALTERLTQAQLEADVQGRQITESIERAFAAYITGNRRVAALRDQVEANDRTVAAYKEEYSIGTRSLLDLLDSENARFNSRFQFQSAAAVHYFTAYQLVAHMGKLLTTLGVEAPAEVLADHRAQSEASIWHIEIEPLRQ